jgi:hypothetical protein
MEKLAPQIVTLEVGKEYYWPHGKGDAGKGLCSQNEVWDNGACLGFTADRTEGYICTCKQTKTAPFCDGSHVALNKTEPDVS